MTHLKQAFESALASEQINKQTFANQRDIKLWQVSRWLNPDITMTKPILECVFKDWETPGLSGQLLYAHIKDLCEANGLAIEEILKQN